MEFSFNKQKLRDFQNSAKNAHLALVDKNDRLREAKRLMVRLEEEIGEYSLGRSQLNYLRHQVAALKRMPDDPKMDQMKYSQRYLGILYSAGKIKEEDVIPPPKQLMDQFDETAEEISFLESEISEAQDEWQYAQVLATRLNDFVADIAGKKDSLSYVGVAE